MIGRSIMGQSYSLDLRARLVGHVRAGHSRREAARHFRVSASCAVKLLKRADRTGSVEPVLSGLAPNSSQSTTCCCYWQYDARISPEYLVSVACQSRGLARALTEP